MLSALWPIAVVVAANCLYNICTKSTPPDASAFLSLTVTYLVAAILSFAAFLLQNPTYPFGSELSKLNWTSAALGLSVVALEFGYICIYRAGWKVNTGSLVANICLAVALVWIGLFLYNESVSIQKVVGICVCLLGLFLIGK